MPSDRTIGHLWMQTNNPGVRQQVVKLHIRVFYGLLNKGVI